MSSPLALKCSSLLVFALDSENGSVNFNYHYRLVVQTVLIIEKIKGKKTAAESVVPTESKV